ncbi:VOC family protein [Dactylosporangium siamense]|uniref:Glyoxalase n=1 Tax=Dactylosporangium siamense TaxID=685454 RepID=A0A919PXJ1_9ACTN|nr:VOC family protein [Dactylosporangium siamense]GIG52144.1 glyoxalase [Dactylosporangium siamense]
MNTLSHIAINADDIPASRAFYRAAFGWQFSAWGPPGFYRVEAEDPHGPGVTAALQQRRQLLADQPTTGFECTVAVDDVRHVEQAALAAGGRLLMQTTTIAGVGHLIWLADPSGNVVGAMQYDTKAQ